MRKRPGRGGALLAVSLLTVPIAACGDDDSAAPPLSAAQLVEQAEAVCADVNDVISVAAGQAFGAGEPTPEQAEDFFNVVVTETTRAHAALSALSAPDELATEWEALLDELAEVNDALETGGARAFSDSEDDPFAGVDERFAALDMPTCADDGE